MHEHYITKCRNVECENIVSQCRCFSTNKTVVRSLGLCASCMEKKFLPTSTNVENKKYIVVEDHDACDYPIEAVVMNTEVNLIMCKCLSVDDAKFITKALNYANAIGLLLES